MTELRDTNIESDADRIARQTAELAALARETARLQDELDASEVRIEAQAKTIARLNGTADGAPDTDTADRILKSTKFDAAWYIATYADVTALGMDPLDHFRRYGAWMGRAPNATTKVSGKANTP